MSEYYLSKNSKVTGPYSFDQIAEMRSSGDLNLYSWLWDTNQKKWTALDVMPAFDPTQNQNKIMGTEGYCFVGTEIFKGNIVNENDFGIEFRLKDTSFPHSVGKRFPVKVCRVGENETYTKIYELLTCSYDNESCVLKMKS